LERSDIHRVPATWLDEHAGAAIRTRLARDVLDDPARAPDVDELLAFKSVAQILRKQKPDGTWGGNILGIAADKTMGVRGPGTVFHYRRLLELGLPADARPLALSNRVFFRLLSRDPDPKLAFEYGRIGKGNPSVLEWGRALMQEGAGAALAQAGHRMDPRLRGAAQRILGAVSNFLRSEHVEEPIIKHGSRNILHPDAHPPTLFSVAMISYLPTLQRERAGLMDRMVAFLNYPAPHRHYTVELGKAHLEPTFHILGDPLTLDAAGRPKDLPFALHWMEILARLGVLDQVESAMRIFESLRADCNDEGVWAPRSLRSLPKNPSGLTEFCFPLEADTKTAAGRRADVTFRLALIASLAGLQLEVV